MNAQQFLTIEWAFGLVISIAITSSWRYVKRNRFFIRGRTKRCLK